MQARRTVPIRISTQTPRQIQSPIIIRMRRRNSNGVRLSRLTVESYNSAAAKGPSTSIGKEPLQLRITALCKDQNGKQQRSELYPSTCLEWNRESKTLEGSDVDWGYGLIDGGCTDCKFQGWTLTCYCDGKNAPPKLLKDRNKVTINVGEHISYQQY